MNSIPTLIAWCLYDWACSSYSVIVITFIFSTYFTTHIAANEIIGTYQWATATSIAGAIVAFLSPVVGAVADHGGYHKRWLMVLTVIAVISCFLLWFAYPSHNAVLPTLIFVVIGTVAYEVAQVFYNAFLPFVVPKGYLGRISGWGWGAGYLGGIVSLSIVLMVFIRSNFFHLNTALSEQIRIAGPFAGLWYGLFALPLFYFAPYVTSHGKALPDAIREGVQELWKTAKDLPKERNILLYLFAHMVYNDGLNTLFAFGGIYAAGTFGLSFEEVLMFGITMNITAGLGAIILAWMDDYFGSKRTIVISLVCLTIFGIPLLLLHQKYYFWAMALLLCAFVGPIQSASRSLMVRLISKRESATEMFGLYALSGKITAFIGPWLLGQITLAFNSQRFGMATVLVFFVAGGLLLLPVREDKGSDDYIAE